MIAPKAFLFLVDKSEFGGGLPCEITGVCYVAARGNSVAEPCFRIRITEGVERYVPIEPRTAYLLLSEDAVRRGEIPEVFD